MSPATSAGSDAPDSASASATSVATAIDVATFKYDNLRTGQDLNETVLNHTNVNSTSFGLLHALPLDGIVDAQPLYLSNVSIAGVSRNVVYAATEHNSVYAIDADTGATLWQVSVLQTGEVTSTAPSCGGSNPEFGITATPVIDRKAGANGAIYVVSMSLDASSNSHQRLHALDITTGAELFNGPTDITASFTNAAGTTTFDPGQYMERAALLLSNGRIYTTWASHCDVPPYGGWIIAFNQTTLAQAAAINLAPNSGIPFVGGSASNVNGPAIWMSGAGPAADSDGNVYLLTANGQFETTPDLNGFPNLGDYGNSFVKLAGAATSLKVADYFTMSDEFAESFVDKDLGSGGVILLPDMLDSLGTLRQLAVGAGKDGIIYVVERGSMGKFNPGSNNNWQTITGGLIGSVFASGAYFNGKLYLGGLQAYMQEFTVTYARVSELSIAKTPTWFGFPGTSPVVSANGETNGIVWAVENNTPSVLHAYDADLISTELYNSNQASGARDAFGGTHFTTPMVAGGKVFIGTSSGLAIFGLLSSQ